MRAQAAVLEKLPKPPVTRDQLKMLAAGDNVVSNSDAVDTFGLPLVPLDEQLRRATSKEARERTKGRFRGPSVLGTSLYWQRRFLPKRRVWSVDGHLPRAPYAG